MTTEATTLTPGTILKDDSGELQVVLGQHADSSVLCWDESDSTFWTLRSGDYEIPPGNPRVSAEHLAGLRAKLLAMTGEQPDPVFTHLTRAMNSLADAHQALVELSFEGEKFGVAATPDSIKDDMWIMYDTLGELMLDHAKNNAPMNFPAAMANVKGLAPAPSKELVEVG